MFCSKTALDLLGADSIVADHQNNLTVHFFQSNPDPVRLSMPHRVCNSLLNHPINRIFFIFIKFQVFLIRFKIYFHIGHLTHLCDHFPDRHLQTEPFQRIRPEFVDGTPDILDPLPAYLGQKFQLLFGLFRGNIHQRQTGIQSGGNPCQRMTQRIVNLPRQTVSLSGLGHPFRHVRIFMKLFVRRLQFMIELIDLLDGASLAVDHIDTVCNKQDHIQRRDETVDTGQILLRIGRIIADIVDHAVQRHVNGQKIIIRHQITAYCQYYEQKLYLAVPHIGNDIGEGQQQKTVIIKIQLIDHRRAYDKVHKKRDYRPGVGKAGPEMADGERHHQHPHQRQADNQIHPGIRRNRHHAVQKLSCVVARPDSLRRHIDKNADKRNHGKINREHRPLQGRYPAVRRFAFHILFFTAIH